MDSDVPSAGIWRQVDDEEMWGAFDKQFAFAPDFNDRQTPAIRIPNESLVVDLAPIFTQEPGRFAAGEAAINACALRAFVWLAGTSELVALDWQHPSYLYSPSAHALGDEAWSIPVFPNGDYYIHAEPSLNWGTFAHPWQQSLTIWGTELIDSLGRELLTWLPKHRHSP